MKECWYIFQIYLYSTSLNIKLVVPVFSKIDNLKANLIDGIREELKNYSEYIGKGIKDNKIHVHQSTDLCNITILEPGYKKDITEEIAKTLNYPEIIKEAVKDF